MQAREREAVIARALDLLDERAREIVVLRFFERLPARDIAQVVGATEGAVRTKLHRVLKSLRRRLGEMKDDM